MSLFLQVNTVASSSEAVEAAPASKIDQSKNQSTTITIENNGKSFLPQHFPASGSASSEFDKPKNVGLGKKEIVMPERKSALQLKSSVTIMYHEVFGTSYKSRYQAMATVAAANRGMVHY